MKKALTVCLSAFIFFGILACTPKNTSTPIEEAPLPAEEQRDLRNTLVGTWGLEVVTRTRGGEAQEQKSQMKWTFNRDGTGKFVQKIAENVPYMGGQKKTGEFEWKLEGRNLILHKNNENPKYFLVESWRDDQMEWFNYEESNWFFLYPIE